MDLIVNKIRVQLLNHSIIRVEYNKNQKFLDDKTFFIPTRDELVKDNITYSEEDDFINITIEDKHLFIPKIQKGLKGVMMKNKDGKIIYRYKKIRNSGELSPINKTPEVFVLSDSPRIILPREEYTVSSNEKYKVEENAKDIYLLLCNKNHRLLRKLYLELTGKNDLVRLSTLGFWNSKYYEYDEQEAKNVILDYEKYDIPLDNMVIDTDWREASDIGIGYNINKKLFPDMKRFFDFAHDHQVEIMFNDHPEPVKGAKSAFDKKEIAFREENLQNILSLGLDYWWYDRNWTTKLISPTKYILPETIGLYLFHEVTKNYNIKKAKNDQIYIRPVIMGNVNNIANGNYFKIYDSASHRYGIQWTGDIGCEYDSIKQELDNLIKGSQNEISYINFDCGGHVGNPNKKLYIRWLQLGVLSPVCRPHCTKTVLRGREPWVYDEETLSLARNYINMRYNLMMVLYANAYRNYFDGEPLIKEIGYNYIDDKKALKNNDEILLGDDILACPVYDFVTYRLEKKNYIGKVKATYFDGTELKGNPIYECEYDVLNKYWDNVAPCKEVPVYNFSARFEMDVIFDEDIIFVVESDDGVKVYIDGELRLSDWSMHSSSKSEVCLLTKDVAHHVVIEYFQAGGEASIALFYHRASTDMKKTFYLPEGEWMDVFDGKIYKGKRYHAKKYDYEIFPLFVRLGSVIPLAYQSRNTSTQKWDKVIYDYYPSKSSLDHGFIYEDDTKTTAYKYNQYRISEYDSYFDEKENCFILDFKSSKGEFEGEKNFSNRDAKLKIHLIQGLDQIEKVLINDEEVETKIHNTSKKVFPFNNQDVSCDSKVMIMNFKQNIFKNYRIKIILKK